MSTFGTNVDSISRILDLGVFCSRICSNCRILVFQCQNVFIIVLSTTCRIVSIFTKIFKGDFWDFSVLKYTKFLEHISPPFLFNKKNKLKQYKEIQKIGDL